MRIFEKYIYSIIVVLSISLGACSTMMQSNRELEEEVKKEILGKNIDFLYSEWGPASYHQYLPSGDGKVYIWRYVGCKSIVTTDLQDTIVNYSATGRCVLVRD